MIYNLVDEHLNVLQCIHWGCLGGLRRTDNFTPDEDWHDEVVRINDWNGYETEFYENECGGDDAQWWEHTETKYVLMDNDMGYDSFNPRLDYIMKWFIERSPWSPAIASSHREWENDKVFYVHAVGCPADLAVSALSQFRDLGRKPATVAEIWDTLMDVDVPEAHKYICCTLLTSGTNYFSWADGDGALLRYSISPKEYFGFLRGERRGMCANEDMSLLALHGYPMSIAGQWGGDDLEGEYYDDDPSGYVYKAFSDVFSQSRNNTFNGMLRPHTVNVVVDYAKFTLDTYNKLKSL